MDNYAGCCECENKECLVDEGWEKHVGGVEDAEDVEIVGQRNFHREKGETITYRRKAIMWHMQGLSSACLCQKSEVRVHYITCLCGK